MNVLLTDWKVESGPVTLVPGGCVCARIDAKKDGATIERSTNRLAVRRSIMAESEELKGVQK